MIEHGSLANFIDGMLDRIDLQDCKSFLCLTTVSFDIFVLETLFPLSLGLRIVLVDENVQKNPLAICRVIKDLNVDLIQATPSTFNMILSMSKNVDSLESLKYILVGGERLSIALLNQLQSSTRAKIYNMYGPTETTVWSSVAELTSCETVHIGKPILNTDFYILDEHGAFCEPGEIGELYISGLGLARGYLNEPDLSQQRLIVKPDICDSRLYKTGDLVRCVSEGLFEVIGRVDNQKT